MYTDTCSLISPIVDLAQIFSKFAPVVDHVVMQNVGMLAIVFIQDALGPVTGHVSGLCPNSLATVFGSNVYMSLVATVNSNK